MNQKATVSKDFALEISGRVGKASAMLAAITGEVSGFQPREYETDKALSGVNDYLDDTNALILRELGLQA